MFRKTLISLSPFSHSHSISNSFRAWWTLNAFSRPFSAVLKEPILAKYKTLNTHSPLQGASFFRRVILDSRERFRRYGSELSRPFEITWNFWRFRMPTVKATMWGLIGVNVAVFMLWTTMDPIGELYDFLGKLCEWENSHTDYFCIQSEGTKPSLLQNAWFLLFRYQCMDVKYAQGLGASHAVNAIVLLRFFLFPKAVYKFYGFIPVPVTLLGVIFIGKDILCIMMANSGISGEAHLGGAVVAALAWARIRSGRI